MYLIEVRSKKGILSKFGISLLSLSAAVASHINKLHAYADITTGT